MNAEITPRLKQEGYIQNSSLILIAFASAFFPRLLETVGFPSLINFVHFAIVPLAFGIVITSAKTKNRYQVATVWAILFGLLILLGVMLVSALLNQAGLINVVADFLILSEPFMLLVAVISIPLSSKSWKRLETWLIYFGFINLFLSYLQNYLIAPYFSQYLHTRLYGPDLVQGVFFISGGGNTLGSGVSLFFSAYYFQKSEVSLWLRVTVFIASLWQMVFGDTKQVLVVFILAWAILSLIKIQDIKKLLMSITGIFLIITIFLWGAENLEVFRAFKTYLNPEAFDLEGNNMQIKLAALNIIPSYYKSPLNLWFGLGPGHTVGRLGQGMLTSYDFVFIPLGATISPVGQAVWDKFASFAIGNRIGSISTAFSPFWGWVGIWGDLGLVGLGAYLYLGYLIWSRVWKDYFSHLLLINIVLFGFMSTQLEEPGYMLYVAIMLGLRWQDNRLKKSQLSSKDLFIKDEPKNNLLNK